MFFHSLYWVFISIWEVPPGRKASPPVAAGICLPAPCCQGMVCWNFQDVGLPILHFKTAGSRLETEKVGSGVGTRKKLLTGLQREVGSAFTLGCQGHDGGGWAVLSEWARVAEADGHQRKAVTDPR